MTIRISITSGGEAETRVRVPHMKSTYTVPEIKVYSELQNRPPLPHPKAKKQ